MGARIVRPTVVLAVSGGVLFGSYAIFMQVASIQCMTRLVASILLCIGSAVLSSCILKIGLFFLGFACIAGSLHLVFIGLPILDTLTPNVGPRSVAYYSVVCVGGLSGGIFLRVHNTTTMEVVTSMIGGVGMAYAVHSFVTLSYGNNVPHPIYLCIGVFGAIIGIVFQRRQRLQRQTRTQPCIRP